MSNNAANSEQDYLSMSDEEMMNAPPPEDTDNPEEEQEAEESDEVEESSDKEEQEEVQEEEEQSEDDSESDEDEEEGRRPSDESESDEEDEDNKKEPNKEDNAIDYEAEYKRILAPFKANGRMVEVDSVDDAISLMQMGANYNKQMAALKPVRKVMKLLENNGLLDEEKLSFLIELDRKNPEAIHKLIKDSGIDPMDHDPEKAGEYKPKIHTVDDRQIALDEVLDEIQDTPSYNRTLGIISKEWDGASKQIVADNPQLIKVINDHVDRGIYDIISNEIEREKMLGRLAGMSDLDAYRYVGDRIQARGGFDHLGSSQGNKETRPKVITPKAKAPNEDRLKDKRRAASPTKPGFSGTPSNDFNPLAMSDEEFEKLADKKYK